MDEQGSVNVLGFRIPVLVAITTLVGAVALLLSYIAGLFAGRDKDAKSNKVTSNKVLDRNGDSDRSSVNVDSSSSSQNPGTTTSVNANGNTTSGKRAKNKKRREAQQEFAHPWMVGALKGHTGPVLDINFSSNGKFLASCAEDCDLVPEEEPEFGDASSSNGEGDYGPEEHSRCQGNTSGSGSSSPSTVSVVTTNSNNRNSKESRISFSSPSDKQLQKVRSSLSSSSSSSSLSQGINEGVITVTADRTSLSRRQRKNRTRAPREQQRVRDRDEDTDDLVTATKTRHRHHHRVHHQSDVKLRLCRDESPVRVDSIKTQNPNLSRINRKSKENPKVLDMAFHYYQTSWYSSAVQIPRVHYVNPRANMTSRTHTGNDSRYLNNTMDNNDYQSSMNQFNQLSESTLFHHMKRYLLAESLFSMYGYPVQSGNEPGTVVIEHYQRPPMNAANLKWRCRLDANAREFVPRNKNGGKCYTVNKAERTWIAAPNESEIDSGTGSGSSVENSDQEPECSSDSDKNSDTGETLFPLSSSSSSSSSSSCDSEDIFRVTASNLESSEISETYVSSSLRNHECARCKNSYTVDYETGVYTKDETCIYHWGKLLNSRVPGDNMRIWECCQLPENSGGCTRALKHVWTGLTPGINGPFKGYVETQNSPVYPMDRNYGAYAIDCEMCFTIWGLELTRVTVVSMTGEVIYDALVKPCAEIIDYNTRFSGITAETLEQATKSLADVQHDLLTFIYSESILVGHGLGNDLRALKMIHHNVIDTTDMYPHARGFPVRKSLKTLARNILKREIQVGEHDSAEDARTAAEIVIAKIRSDIF